MPRLMRFFALDNAEAALRAMGGSLADVSCPRMHVAARSNDEAVAREHARRFALTCEAQPTSSLVHVGLMRSGHMAEVEMDAEIVHAMN